MARWEDNLPSNATLAERLTLKLISRALTSLSLFAIAHPWRVLCIAALIIVATAPGMLRLRLQTDGRSLISKDAPEFVYDQQIRARFGIRDQLVVLVSSTNPRGIFNSATVQLVRELSAELQKLPDVSPRDVMSLATEPGFRLRPGTLTPQLLLEPPLKTSEELEQLRDDLRRIELYNGTLVSTNGKATVLLVGVPDGVERARFCEQVQRIINSHRTAENQIALTGAPAAETLLGLQVLEDLGLPHTFLPTSASPELSTGASSSGWRAARDFLARRVGLVPTCALVMMLVLLLYFRSLAAALLPLPGVVATMSFVFGLMGWMHQPIYITTAIMPVLLTVISVTNDIYLVSRYAKLLQGNTDASPPERLRETMTRLARPIAVTSLTGVIGFLSFAFSPLVPVRSFGCFAGLGALFGLFFSLTAVPALMTLLKPAWFWPVWGENLNGALGRWFGRAGGTFQRPWVIAGTLVIIAMMGIGIHRLTVQDSWTSGFAPESGFRQATRAVNEQFFGMHVLLLCAEAPKQLEADLPASAVSPQGISFPGSLLEDPGLISGNQLRLAIANGPNWNARIEAAARRADRLVVWTGPRQQPDTNFLAALEKAGRARYEISVRTHLQPKLIGALGELGAFLREQSYVGGVLGPMDYLITTRFMAHPNAPGVRVLPEAVTDVNVLWNYYESTLGHQRLWQIVDTNYSASITTVFLKDANFIDTASLMRKVRAYEQEHLAPEGIRLGFAGDVAVSQSLIRGIVSTQMYSLVWALVGIFGVTAWFGGSFRWGCFCVLPSLLAVAVKFGVMGWADIPLGVATSMFAAMTLGIGVNCAIHLLENHAHARAAGMGGAAAVEQALALTGPPALINTIAVSLGFSVLTLSQVPANARLGLLVVLGLVNCFLLTMILLPRLLRK